ncbi:carbohydrate-binding module family 5 protein [Athelia psychrophila]|uniref:chitinase n=1 Tax=Athelia psychrophila TaxID=1759441 RepID=A0A166V175_9AGAM|nr:carbohydrate-binding module family 5 protein [Fibularhizoctonia sp. CBS 109695]
MPGMSLLHDLRISALLLPVLNLMRVAAFSASAYDNVAVYWGQNSYGAVNSADTANFQKPLAFYCADDTIDIIPIAFVDVFFGAGGAPSMDLANTCNPTDNTTFSGTALPECTSVGADITTCQGKGKLVTLSLGGATGAVGFTDDTQAATFAQTIWDDYFEGNSSTRPFGSAVLDGIDLDIEGGSASYTPFLTAFRKLSDAGSKTYYVSGAPQCEYPDAALGATLNTAKFDMVYVQFYNNPCGLQNYATASEWDFGLWDNWARNVSTNSDVKVYIGAPAATSAAGGGYQTLAQLSNISTTIRNSFPSFGGVMLWDASQAYANSRYDKGIKTALTAAGSTGFTYPDCSAPTYVSGTDYTSGAKVSYGGYIWAAKFYASSTPANTPNGEWSAISACGSGSNPTSTSPKPSTSSKAASGTASPTTTSQAASPTASQTTGKSVSTTASTTTSTSASPSSTPGGNCAGVAAWSSSVAYTGGSQVTYNGGLWTADYWTESDTPGGSAGVWKKAGTCSASNLGSTRATRQCSLVMRPSSHQGLFKSLRALYHN